MSGVYRRLQTNLRLFRFCDVLETGLTFVVVHTIIIVARITTTNNLTHRNRWPLIMEVRIAWIRIADIYLTCVYHAETALEVCASVEYWVSLYAFQQCLVARRPLLNSRRCVYLQPTGTPGSGREKQSWKFSTDLHIWRDVFLLIRAARNLTVAHTVVTHGMGISTSVRWTVLQCGVPFGRVAAASLCGTVYL